MRRKKISRRGSVLPLVVISLVGLFGFVALAIDVGMILVAKTQCQNAADTAAMTGARAIDGSNTPNLTYATAKAVEAATANEVLNRDVVAADVTVTHGAYHYNTAQERFEPNFPPVAPDNYNLTQVQVRYVGAAAFAKVFGSTPFDVSASAIAAHRPRDVCMVFDFSGSMNNESDLWNNEGYLGANFPSGVNQTSNNVESVFPRFGGYSDVTTARLQSTSTDPRVGKSNVSISVLGMPALVDDYYQHDRGTAAVKAFSAAADSFETTPGGDNYLVAFGTSTTPPTYAKTVQEITNSGSTPFNGYQPTPFTGYSGPAVPNFAGYTQGPRYWGKTFFLWPPDPDPGRTDWPTGNLASQPPKDWRRRFFLKAGGAHPTFGGPMDDNTKLWDGGGNWRDPVSAGTTNYVINYRAILHWLKNTGPNAFPTKMRSGRILYYDQIPDDVPVSAYTWTNANSAITDANQRVWKEYIDYTLGVWRDPFGNRQAPQSPACSIGPDFTWGTIKISTQQSGLSNGPPNGTGVWNRIDPQDNPKRPRHRFWFGPMTWVQFLSDTGKLSGTVHDISMFPAKLGIAGALEDIRNNHPNDQVAMLLYCRPQYNNDPAGIGSFSTALYSLGRDYTSMINSLYFPPNSAALDVTLFDANDKKTPRTYGDFTANTATMHGLMLSYNEYSGSSYLRTVGGGGFGRKGSQRLIVLETDGMANVNTNAVSGLQNNGPYNSYYRINAGDVVNSAGYNQANLLTIVDQICAPDTANPPGYATPRKPVIIHTVAFGAIFEPTSSGTTAAAAVTLLQEISARGGTVFPSTSTDPEHGFKWCIGTLDERKNKLRDAFNKIMDAGVSVSLIK